MHRLNIIRGSHHPKCVMISNFDLENQGMNVTRLFGGFEKIPEPLILDEVVVTWWWIRCLHMDSWRRRLANGWRLLSALGGKQQPRRPFSISARSNASIKTFVAEAKKGIRSRIDAGALDKNCCRKRIREHSYRVNQNSWPRSYVEKGELKR